LKKLICLLLALWLPLFFSAASFASTTMQLDASMDAMSSQIAEASQASTDMPEHCKMHMAEHSDQSGPNKTSHEKCEHCGLCINIVYYSPNNTAPTISNHHPLSAHVAWVSSPHLSTPNHRPPIQS